MTQFTRSTVMSDEEKGFILREKDDIEAEETTSSPDENTKPADEPAGDKVSEDKPPEDEPPEDEPTEDEPPEDELPEDEPEEAQFPKVDFSTFSFSLNQSALMHLGVIADPTTGKKSKNLSLAKQTIDILGMLEEKTAGNLTKDESDMLVAMLYNLRMIYIKERE